MRAATLLLVAAPLLLSGAAHSFELLAATTTREGSEYLLHIEAVFSASPERLVAVMTDFDRIHELHPSIIESRSLGPVGPATEEVYSRFEGCVLLVCRTIHRVEHIRVDGGALFARDVPGRGSFRSGQTEWHFTPHGTGAKLRYETRFVPAFMVAPILGTAALLRFTKQMTLETMAEADRRAAQARD